MKAETLFALPSVPVVIAERAVRCHVLSRRTRNPCPNPALDPDAQTPICGRHLIRIAEEAARLLGRPALKLIMGDGD